MYTPPTLQEAAKHFSDAQVCHDYLTALRWPSGVTCPRCGTGNPYFVATRRIWRCRNKECARQFSVKVGTIFEDSPLGLDKWLVAMWLEANSKNGASSWELSRAVGVTQKTAWFMMHRIHLAMQAGSFEKLSGTVEADETLIGGKITNMHPAKKVLAKGRPNMGKAIVMGLLERKGEVRTKVVKDATKATLQAEVKRTVKPGSAVYTDALKSYEGLDEECVHEVINHAEAYVRGNVHTNSLENFWSLFKRCVKGTHVSIEPYHLFRYLDAEGFRFNNRKGTDAQRFARLVEGVAGKRVTYNELIGQGTQLDSGGCPGAGGI